MILILSLIAALSAQAAQFNEADYTSADYKTKYACSVDGNKKVWVNIYVKTRVGKVIVISRKTNEILGEYGFKTKNGVEFAFDGGNAWLQEYDSYGVEEDGVPFALEAAIGSIESPAVSGSLGCNYYYDWN